MVSGKFNKRYFVLVICFSFIADVLCTSSMHLLAPSSEINYQAIEGMISQKPASEFPQRQLDGLVRRYDNQFDQCEGSLDKTSRVLCGIFKEGIYEALYIILNLNCEKLPSIGLCFPGVQKEKSVESINQQITNAVRSSIYNYKSVPDVLYNTIKKIIHKNTYTAFNTCMLLRNIANIGKPELADIYVYGSEELLQEGNVGCLQIAGALAGINNEKAQQTAETIIEKVFNVLQVRDMKDLIFGFPEASGKEESIAGHLAKLSPERVLILAQTQIEKKNFDFVQKIAVELWRHGHPEQIKNIFMKLLAIKNSEEAEKLITLLIEQDHLSMAFRLAKEFSIAGFVFTNKDNLRCFEELVDLLKKFNSESADLVALSL